MTPNEMDILMNDPEITPIEVADLEDFLPTITVDISELESFLAKIPMTEAEYEAALAKLSMMTPEDKAAFEKALGKNWIRKYVVRKHPGRSTS